MIKEFDDDTIRSIFGHEAAEDDDIKRLKQFYFKNTTYSRLRANHPLRLLIGHKGIGKSAMLAVAVQEDIANKQLAISLRPDDIAEISSGGDSINTQIRGWKEGLRRIICRKVFEFFSLNNYIDQNAHTSTWLAIATDFGKTIMQMMKGKGIVIESSKEAILAEFCRDSVIRVYIDDLDRGWDATKDSVTRISAMLNAVRDISREFKNIHFVVSLRSDVYYLVRTSDESTDKLESACIWFSWTNHEILAMLISVCPLNHRLSQIRQSD